MLGGNEALGVCDLFGEQVGNVSRSGAGDRAEFNSNMRRFGKAHDRLQVFAKPSSQLSPDEIGGETDSFISMAGITLTKRSAI